MQGQTTVRGQVRTTLVDRRLVDSVLERRSNAALYKDLMLFSAGIVVSAATGLLAGSLRPAGLWILFFVSLALSLVGLVFWLRERRGVKTAARVLEHSETYVDVQTTVGTATITVTAGPSGAGGMAIPPPTTQPGSATPGGNS